MQRQQILYSKSVLLTWFVYQLQYNKQNCTSCTIVNFKQNYAQKNHENKDENWDFIISKQ